MKRVVFLDYIRVFACFLVMIVHASECYYVSPNATPDNPIAFINNETDRLWVSLYDGFSRIAVPLFMIVSAFLLAPANKEQTSWIFYKRRFKRILPPFFIFMVLYSTLPYLWGQLDYSTSINDLSRIILNFPTLAGHLWFIYPLISLYLFIPVISPWLEKASRKEELFFIVLFLLSSCMPYLKLYFGNIWGQCSWNEFHALWYFSGYLGYLVIAHYIRVHLKWGKHKRIFIGTTMAFIGALFTILSFYLQAIPGVEHYIPTLEIGWAFCSINCVIFTIGSFLLFSCIKREKTPVVIEELSKLSYGMYLAHMFWLFLWAKIIIYEMNVSTGIAIPLMAVGTFVCSYISIKIISFLPKSKWIIG